MSPEPGSHVLFRLLAPVLAWLGEGRHALAVAGVLLALVTLAAEFLLTSGGGPGVLRGLHGCHALIASVSVVVVAGLAVLLNRLLPPATDESGDVD